MAELSKNEILGYCRNNKLYCLECSEDSLVNITLKEVLCRDGIDSDIMYFCDICGRQI